MKKHWMIVTGSALVFVGLYVFRTYPRYVAMTLHGTRDRSLFGPKTFSGTVDITGATLPDRANGKYQTIPFVPHFGGLIVYYSTSNQFHEYGAIYPNQSFTEFAVQKWQHSGWSAAHGLVIAAPAQTRAQALRLSNELMQAFLLPGHPLK